MLIAGQNSQNLKNNPDKSSLRGDIFPILPHNGKMYPWSEAELTDVYTQHVTPKKTDHLLSDIKSQLRDR